jgi:acyl-coenzyme A synthetase/AMP-(fatty) acid ligase
MLNQKKIFLKSLQKNLNENFLIGNESKLSFQNIFSYIVQINNYLIKNNLEKKIVIIQFENRFYTFIFYIAAIFSKTTICPLDPKLPEERVSKIKKLINAKKIIKKINLSEKILFDESKLNFSNHKFLITFSSGTSGDPKGIVHDSDNILGISLSYSKIAKFNKNTVILHCLPEYYMAGIVNTFFAVLSAAGKVVVIDSFNRRLLYKIWSYIHSYSINVVYLIPSIYSMITNFSTANAAEISQKNKINFFSTSNNLYPNIRKIFFKKFKIKIKSCYGITEMGGPLTNEIKPSFKTDSVGSSIRGCEIKVKKIDNKNFLLFKSKYQCKYLIINGRKKKIEIDKYGYFNSNDTGFFKKNDLILTGREKDIIKKGGEYINLKDIENIFMECHFVNEVAAIGIEDDLSDEKLYIYILTKLKKIKEKDISYLLNFVKKKMYKTERPDKIIFLKTIPKTLSGKIIKRKLKYINAQDKIREIIL